MTAEDVVAALDRGVVVAPGTFFGTAGDGYVRFALVPSVDDCRRGAAMLEAAL